MKFLLVIENKKLREYIKKLISDHNDECLEFVNGMDINSKNNEYKPDWLFIDLQWKKENAFKLTETLRIKNPATNIALLSDVNDERFRLKAEKVGVSAFIPKENLFELFKIIFPEDNIE